MVIPDENIGKRSQDLNQLELQITFIAISNAIKDNSVSGSIRTQPRDRISKYNFYLLE